MHPGIAWRCLADCLRGSASARRGRGWDAYSHLQLDTHAAPVAGILSFAGFLVVVVAMWSSRPGRRQAKSGRERRAA